MTKRMRFKNRMHAGKVLAEHLAAYAKRSDVIVLALPRGGVPVGYEVAKALEVPLDIVMVRKLGVPGHEEYAMGAIASHGYCVLQTDLLNKLQIPLPVIEAIAMRALEEIARREQLYRKDRPALQLRGQTVILVDDGLATGSTMMIAAHFVREHDPVRVIVAVPVASAEACRDLADEVDEMICLQTPDPFEAVSIWYDDFEQTTDEEVTALMKDAEQERAQRAG